MKDITIENSELEAVVFDVGALMVHLQRLSDSRQARGKRYSLSFLLSVILFAKISGEDKPYGIAEWVKLRRGQLVSAFHLERDTVPSLNTIRRTLAETVSVHELHKTLRQYLHQRYGGQQSVLVVIDGKILRGTIAKGEKQGVHLLAAYLPEEGVVLLQVAVEQQENEISAAPRLLNQLDLRGRIVCGDALFTQKSLSVQITSQGGDFIWFVKDNQPQLQADVVQFFLPPRKATGWQAPQLPQESATLTEKSHGRLEQRRLTLMTDETQFIDWPCLKQVFKLERRVTDYRTGAMAEETVYGITSLLPKQATAVELLAWTRSYWGIENGLHYRRDKTLQEDDTRMSIAKQAQVMATLNNFIVGLSAKLGFTNLASARRRFDAEINKQLLSGY